VLGVVGPCSSFGEMAVIDGGPRIATAAVREASVLLELPRAHISRLLDSNPAFARAMLTELAQLVRRVDEHAADLVLLDLRSRVAKFLAAAASAAGELSGAAEVPVDIRLSQTELAMLVGGSRQQLNRIIGELADSGAVVRRGSRIVAVRPHQLRSWSDGV
jgi:CRP/FNR family cyclic AMP-dependent transcriptional regulator